MIGQLMQAMVERAPKKARALQNRGPDKLEAYCKMIAQQAMEEVRGQGVPDSDPNRQQMVREIAFQTALETALEDGSPPETM